MTKCLFKTKLNNKEIEVHSDTHAHRYVVIIDGSADEYSKKIGQMILLVLQKIKPSDKMEEPVPIPADV